MKVKLYEPFQKWYHGGTIWLISDTHFQKDTEMEQFFGWPSAEERLKMINECVTKNDTLIHLGDVGDRLDLISQIKCGYKVLFTGNHDAGNSIYKRKVVDIGWPLDSEDEAKKRLKEFHHHNILGNIKPDGYISLGPPDDERYQLRKDNRLFDEVYDGPQFINNKIVLSHEPFDTAYADNIHGHVHCAPSWVTKRDNTIEYNKEFIHLTTYAFNMASDVIGFKPIRLDKIIEKYPLKNIQSIHDVTIKNATRN